MKRILTLLTLIVLVGSASVLGTMAYHRNAAPEGQGIAQTEYQRGADDALVPFAQNQPFFPASHASNFFDSPSRDTNGFWTGIEGAVDKIVKVTNNGNSPCYFRTLFAFQNTQDVVSDGYLQMNWNQSGDYKIEKVNSAIDVNGVPYIVYVATYQDALPAGATSPASLMQFVLRSDTPYGNMVGEYRILAVSQAYWQETEDPEFSLKMLPDLLGDNNDFQNILQNAVDK